MIGPREPLDRTRDQLADFQRHIIELDFLAAIARGEPDTAMAPWYVPMADFDGLIAYTLTEKGEARLEAGLAAIPGLDRDRFRNGGLRAVMEQDRG